MSQLPKIVEQLSFEDIKNRKVTKFKEIIPSIANNLVDSDPAIALLEESSYTEGLLRNRINQSINSVMLDYACGSDLDNLGKLYGIERKLIDNEDNSSLPPKAAVYETDRELRQRIIEAPKGFSVAGPRSAYIYYGKLADRKVKDISAVSNTPMEIDITVLSYDDNGIPNEDLINKVYEKLNSEEIRPMGDKVTVKQASLLNFELDLQIVFKQDKVVDKNEIIKQIKNNLQLHVNAEHRLEGYISHAGLYGSSFNDNVQDIIIISPKDNIKCLSHQAPFCKSIKINELINNFDDLKVHNDK